MIYKLTGRILHEFTAYIEADSNDQAYQTLISSAAPPGLAGPWIRWYDIAPSNSQGLDHPFEVNKYRELILGEEELEMEIEEKAIKKMTPEEILNYKPKYYQPNDVKLLQHALAGSVREAIEWSRDRKTNSSEPTS